MGPRGRRRTFESSRADRAGARRTIFRTIGGDQLCQLIHPENFAEPPAQIGNAGAVTTALWLESIRGAKDGICAQSEGSAKTIRRDVPGSRKTWGDCPRVLWAVCTAVKMSTGAVVTIAKTLF